MKILILGHTGHIGRGLFEELGKEHEVNGSSRSEPWDDWIFQRYDIIINCVGTGTPKNTAEAGNSIIETTFLVDQAVLSYLNTAKGKNTMYVYLSSGVADERFFDMSPYAVSKVAAEMIHRAHKDKWIIDLRIYSYLSEYIDLDSGYLITEMIKCAISGDIFEVKDKETIREYIGCKDLSFIISNLYNEAKSNFSRDISARTGGFMQDLLNLFYYRYDLKYSLPKLMPYFEGKRTKYYSHNIKVLKGHLSSENLVIQVCDKIIARERESKEV
jgi:dTDP-4-dehydrorhamnose reductase